MYAVRRRGSSFVGMTRVRGMRHVRGMRRVSGLTHRVPEIDWQVGNKLAAERLLDEAVAKGVADGRGSALDAELGEDVLDVLANGARAD